ncbi:tail assembly chaperone [Ruegeria phage DSS3-P1]|uniref:tail assembly chaperone n=1 Tax=Ruegeria phage DSS3-P1 TaxID=1555208 RepID=UPI0002357D41|nr:tail assembly chaperone [Ruegeria phage DSS3-P1]YP_009997261.1 tail assembly chaperone [Ruegeria phage vB_RpoS-V18]YP_009997343.1 tail assembly chaperone [Ruegeria phage vB_RpoS-V11]YP_009997426.1 tail assembly chaperone [Ruegeria phage vB_RpoS-V7]AET42299.1 hypothetical protein SDSG_00033 [Ruegeria phage DSS3-P1]AIT13279.1 hypothetical protein DSS3P1_44 [Ruegeria phage DSS3-P1]AWY08748.1 hypothetical protein vBRpoSV7_45 [Ruegeria phage vB_RpoS-V7]AWY08920.1 hypothetical protein vBRpoSV18
MTEPVVTIQDARSAGFCVSGVKRVCASHNLDFRALVKTGLPLGEVEIINDIHVQRVVTKTKERIAHGEQ